MKRHSADLVSLGFGVGFLAIVGWWAINRFVNLDWNFPHAGWVAAGGLILIGLLGIAASLRSDRRRPPGSGPD